MTPSLTRRSTRLRRVRCVRGAAATALALGLSAWAPYGVAAPVADDGSVDLGGEPVDSSTDSAAPIALDAGLWSVALNPGTQTQYFSYDRQIDDSSVHVGVVGAAFSPGSDGVYLSTHVPSPESPEPTGCGEDYESTSSPALVGAAVIIGDESEGDPCLAADTITIEVERYSSSSTEELTAAIKIVEEAPVSDPGSALAETEDLGYDVPDRVEPRTDVPGAASFGDAPVVDVDGGAITVAAEITQGTELLWRVPLDWGDQLVVRGDLPEVTSEDPLLNTSVELDLVQPSRDVFAIAKSEDYTYGTYAEDPPDRLVLATYPLRYANRDRDLDPTLPGDYWVGVSVEPPAEGEEPVTAPIELTFAVTTTDAAAPTYQRAVLGQGDVDAPTGYSADTPFLVGDGEFSAVASGNPFSPDDADDGDAWWGPRRAAGLGVGVASLACCLAGALWLRARRSAASH